MVRFRHHKDDTMMALHQRNAQLTASTALRSLFNGPVIRSKTIDRSICTICICLILYRREAKWLNMRVQSFTKKPLNTTNTLKQRQSITLSNTVSAELRRAHCAGGSSSRPML